MNSASEAYKKGRQRALNMMQRPPIDRQAQLEQVLEEIANALCDAEKRDDTEQISNIYNTISGSILKLLKE